MDPGEFVRQAQVFIVAGKGGVGKTTVAAALAVLAAQAGRRVLIVAVEPSSPLASRFGRLPLSYEETEVWTPGPVIARTIPPDRALLEYLDAHGLRRFSKRLVKSGVLEVVATSTPGIGDLLVLGKLKQLANSGRFDTVIVDAPASGHALRFLQSPRGLADAVRSGPVRQQADDVLSLFSDPARCRVLLVTLLEETPVAETIETAFALEDRAGVALGALVANQAPPPVPALSPREAAGGADGATRLALTPAHLDALDAVADLHRSAADRSARLLGRLADELPLPLLRLPVLDDPSAGPAAAALASAVRELV